MFIQIRHKDSRIIVQVMFNVRCATVVNKKLIKSLESKYSVCCLYAFLRLLQRCSDMKKTKEWKHAMAFQSTTGHSSAIEFARATKSATWLATVSHRDSHNSKFSQNRRVTENRIPTYPVQNSYRQYRMLMIVPGYVSCSRHDFLLSGHFFTHSRHQQKNVLLAQRTNSLFHKLESVVIVWFPSSHSFHLSFTNSSIWNSRFGILSS